MDRDRDPAVPTRRRWLAACAAAGLAVTAGARAQQHQGDARVKSRLALNLARFTTWPADAFEHAGGTFVLALISKREDLIAAFAELRGQSIGSHTIQVVVNPPAFPRPCHLLFVDGQTEPAPGFWRDAAASPTLTVGDADSFALRGMVALVNANDTLRFDVNLASLRAAQLSLSSQVLKLARKVRE